MEKDLHFSQENNFKVTFCLYWHQLEIPNSHWHITKFRDAIVVANMNKVIKCGREEWARRYDKMYKACDKI